MTIASLPAAEVLPARFSMTKFAGISMVPRDRLVSRMLQDRGVLRLISAPHGYGKSVLAYQYAQRMFFQGEVCWLEGSSPEFFDALDAGFLPLIDSSAESLPKLVIIDNVGSLDERRAVTLSMQVEILLYRGTEVVVTTLPSCDHLRNLQPDRLLIQASDLAVTERDIRSSPVGRTPQERVESAGAWADAGENLFGLAPCSVWPVPGGSDLGYLTGFFEEDLPSELFRAAFCMMVLGRGSLADLERLDVTMRPETEDLLVGDYEFLHVDTVQGEFSVGRVSIQDLQRAISTAGVESALLRGSFPLHEKLLGFLLDAGEIEKAGEVLEVFCSNAQCESWLSKCGWELLDLGEGRLLDALFDRCQEKSFKSGPMIRAVKSWYCGLCGEFREAAFFAQQAFDVEEGESDPNQTVAELMAYLSHQAFSLDDSFAMEKPFFHVSERTQPTAFLMDVVNACTEEELRKALAVLNGHFGVEAASQSKPGASLGAEREAQLEDILAQYLRRVSASPSFCLGLHLLASLDSPRIREMFHDASCGLVMNVRKNGVRTFSQAVLIWDLWRTGYFGNGGKRMDVRDSKLMSSAGLRLGTMAQMSGKEPPSIPWDLSPVAMSAPQVKRSRQRRSARSETERLPVANVKMFGCLEVTIGEKFIPEEKWGRRPLQLFAILVLNQGRDVAKDTIFEMIWPELTRTRALDNFYTTWSRIQALLGEGPYLARRGDFCRINSRYVVSDVAEFERLVRRLLTERQDTTVMLDIYARLESLYRGSLIPSELESPFITAQREHYRSIYVDAMIAGANRSLEIGDSSVALWFARRAMEEDGKREDVFAAMMAAQIAAGQRCSAIRTFFRCKEYLSEELGLDPEGRTQEMYDRLILAEPGLENLKFERRGGKKKRLIVP